MPHTGNAPEVAAPFSDFLLLLASHGSIILKLKSSGRKYASISCASVTDTQSAICGSTDGKCAVLRAVFSCNGGRFGLQYGAYCNAKRHVLEGKTARIAACFVRFYYQKCGFRVLGLCFLTIQSCPRYLVAQFQSHVFLYNILYKNMPEGLADYWILSANIVAHTGIRYTARQQEAFYAALPGTGARPDKYSGLGGRKPEERVKTKEPSASCAIRLLRLVIAAEQYASRRTSRTACQCSNPSR